MYVLFLADVATLVRHNVKVTAGSFEVSQVTDLDLGNELSVLKSCNVGETDAHAYACTSSQMFRQAKGRYCGCKEPLV